MLRECTHQGHSRSDSTNGQTDRVDRQYVRLSSSRACWEITGEFLSGQDRLSCCSLWLAIWWLTGNRLAASGLMLTGQHNNKQRLCVVSDSLDTSYSTLKLREKHPLPSLTWLFGFWVRGFSGFSLPLLIRSSFSSLSLLSRFFSLLGCLLCLVGCISSSFLLPFLLILSSLSQRPS